LDAGRNSGLNSITATRVNPHNVKFSEKIVEEFQRSMNTPTQIPIYGRVKLCSLEYDGLSHSQVLNLIDDADVD